MKTRLLGLFAIVAMFLVPASVQGYYDPTAGRFLSPDPAGFGGSTWDLYSYADNDPINNLDADGRFASGMYNGVGMWASERYAGLGNLLDAVLKPLVGAHDPMYAATHFSGGYEADWRYQQNFEQGSTAFQMGHYAGYAGAEVGFQVGVMGLARGIGTLAGGAAFNGGMSGAAARMGGTMPLAAASSASVPVASQAASWSLAGATTTVSSGAAVATTTASTGAGMGVKLSVNALRERVLANVSANQAATANISRGLISMDLRALTTIAARDVDAAGVRAFTPAQQNAVAKNPNLFSAYRGSTIDAKVRDAVRQDPLLNFLQGRPNRGPDFIDQRRLLLSPSTPQWWDMTTPTQWPAHLRKYGTGGILLPTR